MKEKCDDKQWMHCRVEKMGCEGCNYEDRPFNPNNAMHNIKKCEGTE